MTNPNVDHFFGIRIDFLICLFITLITFAVYIQVLNHDFTNFDDNSRVTENHYVNGGLTHDSFFWAFSFKNKNGIYWHPLTWLSHILDCQLYGLNSGMHHLTSLIIHMVNSILLFLVFNRMTGELWKSAFIALLFAIHPINVESVVWVAERKNVLSTFFWMLTIYMYAAYTQRAKFYRYLLVFFFFALGLLAKPMLVTLPFALLLLDYWPLKRVGTQIIPSAFRLIVEKMPLFLLSGTSIYLSILSRQGTEGIASSEQVTMGLRIANALVSYVGYIGKMLWPQNLAVYYPFPDMVPIWKAAFAGLFLVTVTLFALLCAKKRPYFSVGWLWFMGTLVPVIGLVQAGLWPAMADRWAYIPFIGLFINIVWGTPSLTEKWPHKTKILVIAATAFLLMLISNTVYQTRYWTNSITLFEHALRVTSNNAVAHTLLGSALTANGRLSEATIHLQKSLQISPESPKTYNGLGVVLGRQGKTDDAVKHFREALKLDQNYIECHKNLGIALANQGESSDAKNSFSEAIRLRPGYAEAHNGLGFVLVQQGDFNEAAKHFSESLMINPEDAEAHNGLGAALASQGNMNEAAKHFQNALRINPHFINAQINLKRALSQGMTEEEP